MPCCCVKILNLCKVRVCGVLELAQSATEAESGVENAYSLVLDFLDTTVTIVNKQQAGENIVFDVSDLNENYEYTGQVFDSAGQPVMISYNSAQYDCIKFKTVINSVPASGVLPVLVVPNTVVAESVIGEELVITGTTEAITGISEDSNTITSNAFIGVRVIVIRGNIPIPGIDPGDGSKFFTKQLNSDFITLNEPLVLGEFFRIQTIPQ